MKVVDRGELPSVSPDGTTVAYLVVPATLISRAEIFLVPAGGGTPRRLQPNMFATPPAAGGHQVPLWSPDGTSVLFHGEAVGGAGPHAWWIAPVAGGEAAALEGVPAWPPWLGRYALAWRDEHLYYQDGEPINGSTLYRVRLAPRPWRASGPAEKLTSYPGVSVTASTSARGRMVLASQTMVTNIWSARLQSGGGTTEGPLEAVTADSTGKRHLSVAADGSRLAYVSYGPPGQANVEAHVRDRATGRESLIAGLGKWPFLDPVLSADGSKVAYCDQREGKIVTYVADSGSSSGRVVCEGCFIRAFFPDPAEALVLTGDRLTRRRLDGSGEIPLLEAPGPTRRPCRRTAGSWRSHRPCRTARPPCTWPISPTLRYRRGPGRSSPTTTGTSGRRRGPPTAGFSTTCPSATGLPASGRNPLPPKAGLPALPSRLSTCTPAPASPRATPVSASRPTACSCSCSR